MQSGFMHLIEGAIHQTGKITLNHKTAADERAHQTSDCTVFAERHQRTEVAVLEFLQTVADQQMTNLLDHEIRLLMRRLGARRNVLREARARTGRAIPDREKSRVVCRVDRTASWLMRLVSNPTMLARKAGA
jgi:hypothetical protein